MEIQDEMSMLSLKALDEAYQMELKAREKLLRKQSSRGKGTFIGKGSQGGRGGSTTPKIGASSSNKDLQMVMLEAKEVFPEEEEAEVEEDNSNVTNVTNWDTDPMDVLRMRGQTKEMPLFLR